MLLIAPILFLLFYLEKGPNREHHSYVCVVFDLLLVISLIN